MVDWIGKFDLLLKRVKEFLDGHVSFVIHDGTAKREHNTWPT